MPFNYAEPDLEPVGRPEESVSSIAAAAWENMSLTGTFVGSITDGWEREGLAQQGKAVSPKEANTMFPGLNADRDITIPEAEFIMGKREQVQANQQIIDSASDSFLKGTVLPFVAGSARAMLDPIDMGINIITGGIGTGLKAGASKVRQIAIDAMEGAVGATIAETAVAKEMTDTFEEYTAKNFLTNVIGASVLQVGIMHGIPAGAKGTVKTLDFMGAKTSDGLVKFADALEAHGVNSTNSIRHLVNKLEELTNKHTEVDMSIQNTLGGKVEVGEDMTSSLKNVIDAHAEGKINDAELIAFRDQALDMGVDERVLAQAMDNEKGFEFNDAEIAEVKKINDDPKNKQGFNPEAAAETKALDDFDPDNIQSQFIKVAEAAEDTGASVDVDGKTVSTLDVKSKTAQDVQEREFFREFAACKRGA